MTAPCTLLDKAPHCLAECNKKPQSRGFPEGVRVYGRKLVWRKAEVEAYLDALFAARDKRRVA